MAIRIRNNWKYKGDENWEWEAFLDDGGTGEIKDIDYVEYILHPTFKNPVRKIDDRESNFALKTSGWGTFNLKAFAYTKAGTKIKLSRDIELKYDPELGTSK